MLYLLVAALFCLGIGDLLAFKELFRASLWVFLHQILVNLPRESASELFVVYMCDMAASFYKDLLAVERKKARRSAKHRRAFLFVSLSR